MESTGMKVVGMFTTIILGLISLCLLVLSIFLTQEFAVNHITSIVGLFWSWLSTCILGVGSWWLINSLALANEWIKTDYTTKHYLPVKISIIFTPILVFTIWGVIRNYQIHDTYMTNMILIAAFIPFMIYIISMVYLIKDGFYPGGWGKDTDE